MVEFTVRLGYAIFTVADAVVPRLRHPAAVARLGPADLRELRADLRRLLVAGRCSRRLAIATLVVGVNLIADGMAAGASSDDRAETAVAAPAALELTDLEVAYRVRGIGRPVLRGVSLHDRRRASPTGWSASPGCGKSTAASPSCATCRATAASRAARSRSAGEDLLGLSEARACASCARAQVSMVYQNPGGALNPSIRVGDQVAEVFAIAGADPKRGATSGRRRCCARCRSPTPTASCGATRTSSRAACSSAS